MFAYTYLTDLNAGNAAEAIGYSRGQGSKFLRDPLISQFIEELKTEVYSRLTVNADYVRSLWLMAMPKFMGEEEVSKITSNGEVSGKHFDSSAVVAALKELGSMTDIYKEGSAPMQQVQQISIVAGGPKSEED